MIYVVTLEDTRLWRNGIEPTVTLHASDQSATMRVLELKNAYRTEREGPPLWIASVNATGIHHEAKLGGEVFRIHVAAKALQWSCES